MSACMRITDHVGEGTIASKKKNQYITIKIKPLFSIMGDKIFKEPIICLKRTLPPRIGAITDLAIHAQ